MPQPLSDLNKCTYSCFLKYETKRKKTGSLCLVLVWNKLPVFLRFVSYYRKQLNRKCICSRVACSRPVGWRHQMIYREAESWSAAWQTRAQPLIEHNKPPKPAANCLTDTAVEHRGASPWQDRPPGILFQHRYAAVIWYPRSVVIWKLNCLPGRITSTLVTVSSCKSGRT